MNINSNTYEYIIKRYCFLISKMNREGLSEKEWLEKENLKVNIHSDSSIYDL